jgi:adenine/guanine phosphoribosyltransferase-like PRPP-binding protein
LVATGGTLSSAINLVHMLGGTGEFHFIWLLLHQVTL